MINQAKQSQQTKLQTLFPDDEQRQAILEVFADSIQYANDTSPGNWIVRERENEPALNVREHVVFRISDGKIWLSLDAQTLEKEGIDPAEKFRGWEKQDKGKYSTYKKPSSTNGY